MGRWKCTVVLVEEGTATTVVLLEFKSSMRSDRGTTPQHPEPPPAKKGAQSGPPLVDLRREARERDAVGVQVLHSFPFLRDFRPRKQEALVRRERFFLSSSANAAAFSPASSMPPPKVGLQRVDENLNVPFLHVKVPTGSIFIVWVPGSVAPSLLEHLPDVL